MGYISERYLACIYHALDYTVTVIQLLLHVPVYFQVKEIFLTHLRKW